MAHDASAVPASGSAAVGADELAVELVASEGDVAVLADPPVAGAASALGGADGDGRLAVATMTAPALSSTMASETQRRIGREAFGSITSRVPD